MPRNPEIVRPDDYDALVLGLDLDQVFFDQVQGVHEEAQRKNFGRARQLGEFRPDTYQSLQYNELEMSVLDKHEFLLDYLGSKKNMREMPLISGGREGLLRIKRAAKEAGKIVRLHAITSRSEVVRDATEYQLAYHFGEDMFDSIDVTGNALPEEPVRTKGYYYAKIGKDLEAQGLRVAKGFADDTPKYLYECAEEDDGLFIAFGDYPWNRGKLELPKRKSGVPPRQPQLRTVTRAIDHEATSQLVIDTFSLGDA